MSANAGNIEYEITLDSGKLITGSRKVKKELDGMGSAGDKLQAKFTQIASAVSAAIASITVGALVNKLITVQRQFDVLFSSLKTMTGGVDQANAAWDQLAAFAAKTPYSLDQAVQGFTRLKSLGLDPSEKSMMSFGNTAAAMGKSLNQMIEAVADASTGEFERLKEFGIKARQNGDQVSMTFQGVTTNIGNNARDITTYLQQIGEVNFAGAMEERANTLDGAISNLSDNIDSLLRTINKGGFGTAMLNDTRTLNTQLQGLNDTIANSQKAGEGLFKQFGNASGFTIGTAAMGALNGTANLLNSTINLLTGGFLNLNENVKLLPESLMTNEQRAAALGGKLQAAEKDLSELQAKLAIVPDNIYLKSETYQAWLLVQQLRAAKEAQDKLKSTGAGQGRGSSNPDTVEQTNKKDDEKRAKAAEWSAKYASSVERAKAEIAKAKEELGTYFTPELEQKIMGKIAPEKKSSKTGGKDKTYSEYDEDLQKRIEKEQELTAVQQLGMDINEGRLKKLTVEEQNNLVVKAQRVDRIKEEKDAQEAVDKAYEEGLKIQQDSTKQDNERNKTLDESNKTLRRHVEEIGLTKEALNALELQRIDDAIAIKEQEAAQLEGSGSEAEISRIQKTIDLLKQKRELTATGQVKQATADATEVSKQFADDLEGDVKNALSTAFQDSKNPGKAFAEALGNVIYTRAANALATSLSSSLFSSGGGSSSSIGILSSVASLFGYGGGRAYGGPTSAGNFYKVNETGQPEMWTGSNGSQYMMPTKDGSVTPANKVGGGSTYNITQSFTVGDVASVSMVQKAVKASQQQLIATLNRSNSYS